MKINPITIKQITFGSNNKVCPKTTNKTNFEKNVMLASNADVVQTNFFKAIGCKIKKAYNILTQNPDIDYIHIPYMA